MKTELSSYVRSQFPSLDKTRNGKPIAYLDGPGGYQVPTRVINAIKDYLINMNANADGSYFTSKQTDEMIQKARQAFADFFNSSWDEVVFGANMTTLNFSLAHALMREMSSGDEVIITEIDHEGNRAPWLELQERGVKLKDVSLDLDSCTLDLEDFQNKLSSNTKVVACNYASNAVGTITEVENIVDMAHEVGAYTVVDAVHYAAHKPTDVQQLDADFLLVSAYKFFGPHVGVMYAKKDILDQLNPSKVRPQKSYPPYKIETGTLNHEGIAGATQAVNFVAEIGEKFGHTIQEISGDLQSRRSRIVAGLLAFDNYEKKLTNFLLEELSDIPDVTIYGPPEGVPRTSTVSFTFEGYDSSTIAKYLNESNLLVWDGDFYATTLVDKLGLQDQGGLVRIGIAPYNTIEELKQLIEALKDKKALSSYLESQDS